jgi:hypothetical protein
MSTPYKIVEVHTGQRVWVRNVEVEVLFTQEDMYPSPIYYFNNTTLVTRLHVNRTVAGKWQNVTEATAFSSTDSILMLGDQNHEGCHYMLDMYGQNVKANATLKSDIVQVGHHGCGNVSKECYAAIGAKLYLWQAGNKFWYSDKGLGPGTHDTGVITTRNRICSLGATPERILLDRHGPLSFALPIDLTKY